MLITVVLLALLSGCAQPQLDQPRANGTFLVIENTQAWVVLVADGKKVEEPGTVVDSFWSTNSSGGTAVSYVVETAHCGRLQWLSEHANAADGLTTRMSLRPTSNALPGNCVIADGLSRIWTVLDYSS
ncbi:hypothetical protein [Pseudomonas sp. 5P_3.1_Bac2]|uniref:hypothetical protein n=1 Tax=Pseudomonas sp. 5P_3.1_Bac2 TaxID=2971617 RepID=UPI0021C6809E|nr:hypothetical protein [Pseudomonas sp. 5P_3.1_Bac2]MCU1716318.1 hypothetical protein [Pseudomonas sp. 5P_3.1_Bac2]